jgi:micrococcal nuclease
MRHLFIFAAMSGVLITSGITAEPTTLSGLVTHVRDGDTIEVGKVPIRLIGVSAPELKEPLGKQSRQFMRGLVLGKAVRCELTGVKTYDRFVGTCLLGEVDIGAAVIEAGLALDCQRYSGGRYADLEKASARMSIQLPRYCKK